MFDGLSPMDWLFLLAALALGFGVVKFMLAQRPGGPAPPPKAPPQAPTTPGPGPSAGRDQDGHGQP